MNPVCPVGGGIHVILLPVPPQPSWVQHWKEKFRKLKNPGTEASALLWAAQLPSPYLAGCCRNQGTSRCGQRVGQAPWMEGVSRRFPHWSGDREQEGSELIHSVGVVGYEAIQDGSTYALRTAMTFIVREKAYKLLWMACCTETRASKGLRRVQGHRDRYFKIQLFLVITLAAGKTRTHNIWCTRVNWCTTFGGKFSSLY